MSGFIWNTLVSAIVGVVSAVGTVWFLSAKAEGGSLAAIFAQRGVYANHIGAWRFTAQKFQTTPEDPLSSDSPVFGEFAVDQNGGGYLELLSSQESHAVTLGFDSNERGALVSKNNDVGVSSTQALFLKPTRDGRLATARSGDVADGSFLR